MSSGVLSEMFDDESGVMTNDDLDDGSEKVARRRLHMSRRKFNITAIMVALFLVAIGLVLTTYFLNKSVEETEFETAFSIFARETAVVADMHAENTFGQLESLAAAVTVTSSATSPFPHELTVPEFDIRTEQIANLTGVEMLMFIPFVPNEEKVHWEDYQLLNQGWILEGYEQRGWNTSHLKSIPRNIYNYTIPEGYNETRRGYVDTGFMDEILTNHTAFNSSGGSVPIAQVGPRLIDTSIVMLDLLTHPVFRKEVIASLEYNVPVISEVEDLEFLLQHVQPLDGSDQFDYSFPRSFTLDQVKAKVGGDSETIGFVLGIIQWNFFFRNFLPDYINGIIVDVQSDCGKSFTYIVNGGRQDEWYLDTAEAVAVDRKYQHLEERFKFFWKEHPKGTSRHCHFDLIISPSTEFANYYLTNDPIIYAGACLGCIVAVLLVFFIYDRYNHKKQMTLTKEKARAEAVVQNLFPKNVADKLVQEQAQNEPAKRGSEWQTNKQEERTKPMAELFPSATIYFADIKGFTAWSAQRVPEEVFTLLETIYGAFDEIAQKRRVFKIETIGDCYVAVCGLPTPRDNHAVTMARFAQDCLEEFRAIVARLDDELGTASLQLRTGIHSGSVTAGVLRGDRARFQLFGDSVNTASRIESNGEGDRIHLSEQFADELIKFKKKHWLTPREDKVQAKGKGLLTTFWLNKPATRDSSVWSSSNGSEKPRKPGYSNMSHDISESHNAGDDSEAFAAVPFERALESFKSYRASKGGPSFQSASLGKALESLRESHRESQNSLYQTSEFKTEFEDVVSV